ncbi:response regulator [Paenibacillus planticolens]|uniref:Response regulator n=1 Tax=Paenibacillus planticolens TaxID=2654976 RepID=A0ABX1ZVF5_9BACL|nr:response regulator [Paenibacillus planticolens]NOV03673.1 response regulator [Paenibacillus planticolens]
MLNAMIVEDNAIYRYAIKSILRWEDYGFQIVSEALNGVHALQLLQEQRVDLIVTDISMPEMNGIDLIQHVKQWDSSIKIVALSSFDDFRYVKEALKLGAEDYLLKHDLEPDTLQQLLQLMNVKILEDYERQKQADYRDANLREMQLLVGRKLLLGEWQTAGEMESQASAVHFPFQNGPTAVVVMEGELPNILPKATEEPQQELITMVIPIKNRRNAVIISCPYEKSERKCKEEALRHASLAVKQNDTVTAGISSIGYALKDWSALYQQAKSALEQSVYEGAGKIYSYASTSVMEVEPAKNNLAIQALAAAMKKGVWTDVEAQIDFFFQSLRERKRPLAELRSLLMEVILLIKTTALEKNMFSERVENSLKQLSQTIEALPLLDEVKISLLDLTRSLIGNRSENAQIRKEIQAAIAYMEEHYAEDITVAKMAYVLHLSSNYLSNLFKNETGMRIVEYMNRCRIRKAKLLLRDPSLKVYEVAAKTGFQETSYFCKVFKEIEGKTVKEFRCEN